MSKNLVNLDIDGTNYSLRPCAQCTTNQYSQNKTVTLTDFNLCDKATVLVRFLNSNKANNITLNVNGTGDINVRNDDKYYFNPNVYYEFMYNAYNNCWEILSENKNSICTIVTCDNNSLPYHRFAYTEALTSSTSFNNRTAIFNFYSSSTNQSIGKLAVCFRQENSTTKSTFKAYWIFNAGFNDNDIIIGLNNNHENTFIDIFYKVSETWKVVNVEIEQLGGSLGSIYDDIKLCNSYACAKSSNPQIIYECYDSITELTDAAKVRGEGYEYTHILYPNINSDISVNNKGEVSTSYSSSLKFNGTANKATTATNLFDKPSIQAGTSNANAITVTAGKQTSAEFTIPYATKTNTAENANKVSNNLVIQLNGGSTEGTNKFTFNGSSAKTINITPSSIGADLTFTGTAPISTNTKNKTVTISHNTSGVTAGNYGESSNKSVLQNKTTDYQNSFKVPYLTVDDKGHVTKVSNSVITLPTNMDTDVAWSTKSLNGAMSPIDTAMDGQWSANRLSFMPIRTAERTVTVTAANANKNNIGKGEKINYTVASEDVIIEYTDNADAAEKDIKWQSYPNITDNTKTVLITTGLTNPSFYLGNNNVSQNKDKHRLRITLTAQYGVTYFDAKKIYIYMSQSGASGCKVLVEKSHCGVYPNLNNPDTYPDDISALKVTDASNGVWEELGAYYISGWAGWNSIPLNVKFGGSLTQVSNVRKIRLTFYFEAYSTGYGPEATNPVKCAIHKIAMVGPTSWSNSGGSFAATGHLYSWDVNKNALFPGGIVPISNNTGFLGNSTYMWQTANIGTIYENNKQLSEKYAAIGHSHSRFETLTVTNLTATNDVKLNAGLNIKNDINFTNIGNNDKFISFKYDSTPQFGWRIGYLGVGQGENNFLAFQSGGITTNETDTWTDALKFGCNTLNATFGGNILPVETNKKDLGSNALSWNNIYVKTIYENGKNISEIYAPKQHTHDDRYNTKSEIAEQLLLLENKIKALSSGLKITGSASPSTFFKGVNTNVTVTATAQNITAFDDADIIKINDIVATKGTGNQANKATLEFKNINLVTNSQSYTIKATIQGMEFNGSASVSARYPIFYGMDIDTEGYPTQFTSKLNNNAINYSIMNIASYNTEYNIPGTLMYRDKYRTSARDYSYNTITNTTDSTMKFFLLVPDDVTQPVGYSMGGAPFVMEGPKSITYVINGKNVTYKIYKSGGSYSKGGVVTLSLTK